MSAKKINLTPEQASFLESQKGMLSVRQLAKHLNVSREELKALLREGSGPPRVFDAQRPFNEV